LKGLSGTVTDRALPFALSVSVVLWVALYNGYPLVSWDSGAYLQSSYLFDVPVSRPVFYGLFMCVAGSRFTLWGVIVLQAVLLVWLLRQVLISCIAKNPHTLDIEWALLIVTAILAVTTPLPWVTGEVMPDVFAGFVVLSLFLLVRADRFSGSSAFAAVILVLSLVVHFTHIPLALGLIVLVVVASRLGWAVPVAGVRRGAACLLLAVLSIPATNWALTGRWFFTDATPQMLLDRFLAEGIAQKLLAERCPYAGYALCAYQSNLPEIPGRYLWDPQSPFARLGGWRSGPEASRLVHDAVRAHPLLVLQRSAEAFGSQLAHFMTFADAERFAEGTGINYEVSLRLPREYPRYANSRQQRGRLTSVALRGLHWWVGATCAIVAVFMCVASRERRPDRAVLLVLCISAVVLNAAVIGAGGSPDDRYAARLMWLLPFAVLASLMERALPYLAGSNRRR
jgi:hypothetical protein